jgi:hypothetical protein
MKKYSFEEKVKRLEEWKSMGSARRLSSGGQRREKSGGDTETSLDSEKNVLKISLSKTREGVYSKIRMQTMAEIGKKVERIGISVSIFTLGTANSAFSLVFYVRISEIRLNPLKYLDPDGEVIAHFGPRL